jgi:ferric-dicitrate binding protein FerR (iron transport regulator)
LVFQNGNISKSVTDPAKYNAWTEGKLVFRGDPMAEVARRIERWYNVKIELGDKELEKYTFRATFQDDTLEDVLRFLSLTSPIRYSITPRELMQDGTYRKEKVTIYLK